MFISLKGTNFVRRVFNKINLMQHSPPDRANFLGFSRNVMLFMGPRHPLPCSQQPITGYYPEAVKPTNTLTFYFFKTHFNIFVPSMSSK